LHQSVPYAGATLANVADFAFKALELTAPATLKSATANDADASIIALVARFEIRVSSLIVGSRDVIQRNMHDTILSQYLNGRVISLTITADPVNEASSRQGSWTMSFQPYFNTSDTTRNGFTESWLPVENNMMHQYKCVTGSASRKLVLTYVPRVHDGNAATFLNLDSVYGEVCIVTLILTKMPTPVLNLVILTVELHCQAA